MDAEVARVVNGEVVEMKIIGDVAGKHVLVVDDTIDAAGTLVHAIDGIRQAGAGDICVCATHAVFSADSAARLANSPITEVVVSNTVPIPAEKMSPKFTAPSIGQHLASAIRSVHEGSSVSQIFF